MFCIMEARYVSWATQAIPPYLAFAHASVSGQSEQRELELQEQVKLRLALVPKLQALGLLVPELQKLVRLTCCQCYFWLTVAVL